MFRKKSGEEELSPSFVLLECLGAFIVWLQADWIVAKSLWPLVLTEEERVSMASKCHLYSQADAILLVLIESPRLRSFTRYQFVRLAMTLSRIFTMVIIELSSASNPFYLLKQSSIAAWDQWNAEACHLFVFCYEKNGILRKLHHYKIWVVRPSICGAWDQGYIFPCIPSKNVGGSIFDQVDVSSVCFP